MNAELTRLLSQAGVTTAADWRNVVILYNYAPIPRPPFRTDITIWNRGFNLAVLSRGRPEYFVKCRPTGDPVLEWETTIRTCLAGSRGDGVSVAPVSVASSERLAVQVSPFLRGPHYGRIVPAQSTGDYLDTLRQVLRGNAELAEIALRTSPKKLIQSPTVTLAAAGADSLAHVATLATLDAKEVSALQATLEAAGEVPSRPQHGDFWWQNLVMVEGHLWAIDFDSYGDVCVPLFDDVTLMLTTIAVRAGGDAVEGLARFTSTDLEASRCRALLVERGAAEGLDASQLTAVLVYYLVRMASNVHRRGGVGYSSPHIAAVKVAAERLAAGDRLLATT